MPFKLIKKYFNLTKNETYFVIAFFVFVSSLLFFTFYGPNYNKSASSVDFRIPKGSTFNQIIEDLYVQGIIPSKQNMKVAAFLLGFERNIKAGNYVIPDGISYVELLALLDKGAPKEQKLVTITEGIWQKDLAKLLEGKLNLSSTKILKLSKSKDFIKELGIKTKNLEGYILPETYYFFEGSSEEEVLTKLVKEMQNIFSDEEIIDRMKELKMNQNQVLTLASIIDGESNIVSEFKRISGVYHNRLRKGWKLQADPTVQYLVRQKRRKANRIYYKDLEIDSKYNTYKYYGLPPSPINNPGKDAIMAALYPEQHNYYYFVANGKGGHNFSKTSREHQNNVIRYRNWRRQNNR